MNNSNPAMTVAMGRTLRPREYETIKFEIAVSAADYPEAQALAGDQLRSYLTWQAWRAVANFEIMNGQPSGEVRSRMQNIRHFLKIDELQALLGPVDPLPPPPAPPASQTPPPARDRPAPDLVRPEDQTLVSASNSVPNFDPPPLFANPGADE